MLENGNRNLLLNDKEHHEKIYFTERSIVADK